MNDPGDSQILLRENIGLKSEKLGFGVLPGVRGKAGLPGTKAGKEFLFGPTGLVSNLWKENPLS